MDAEKWSEIKRIFHEAIDLPIEKREEFLTVACAGNKEILNEVEKLIASDAEAETLSDVLSTFDAEQSIVDRHIGNYKILRELGHGGMGTVYLAAREDFEKQVALKIVKHEFSSKELLRRFQNERQILASLEHPNIARLLDGGTTENGLPYFVMEYVAGEDFLSFCKNKDLSIAERLKIFRKVCAAVAYAHGKLIVHRDLKPSNIIVTPEGEPKLLDFGISKILSEESFEHTGTATALGMMTPNYASPEQFRGESVSTATDVYSLGVILYELLTDSLPYDVTNRRLNEVARVICETAPQKPSEVLTAQQQTSKTDSKFKSQTSKSLRGDLDNIILKSLRKEPERRYTSVEKFSDDLRRHLEGLPVTARPDVFSYRAEKFIKRNRPAVVAGLLILLTLLAGIAATTYQSIRAERQRTLAEKRFNQVRELANSVVFKYHDAIANLPGSTEARKMLVTDATNYLDNLAQDASSDAALQLELAQAYLKLADVQGKTYYSNVGDTKGAIENYRKAATLLTNMAESANHETRSKARDDLITVYQTLGMMQSRVFAHEDSVATQEKALRLVEEKLKDAPGDFKLRYQQVRANGRLADSLRGAGKFDEAMAQFRKTLALDEQLYADAPDNQDAEAAIGVLNDRIGLNLALRASDLKRINAPREETDRLFAESVIHLEKMFAVFQALAAKHPENKKYKRDLSTAYLNLGMALRGSGNLNRSLEFLEKDLAYREKVVSADPADRESQADLAEALMETAMTLSEKRQFDAAFIYFKRGLQIFDRLNENDAANSEFRARRFEMANNYGDALLKKGDALTAAKIYESAFEILKAKTNSSNEAFLIYAEGVTNENIGDCYAVLNKNAKSKIEVQKVQDFYQNALKLWQREDVHRGYLNRTPERIDFLKQKLAGWEQEIAKL